MKKLYNEQEFIEDSITEIKGRIEEAGVDRNICNFHSCRNIIQGRS